MYLLQFFNHHRYIKIDGRPVFIIYRIGHGMMCYPSIQTSSSLNHISIHQSIYSSISLLSITIAYQLCYPCHNLITSNHLHSSHSLSTSTLIINIYLSTSTRIINFITISSLFIITIYLSIASRITIYLYTHHHYHHYLSIYQVVSQIYYSPCCSCGTTLLKTTASQLDYTSSVPSVTSMRKIKRRYR